MDDIVKEREERQGKKSVQQLYSELAEKSSKKVSNFEEWHQRERLDFSHIPGRARPKQNLRAAALRKKQEEERRATEAEARIDWTSTDEFGNLVTSVQADCLELSGVPDKSASRSDGPVYPRGKQISSLHLVGDLLHANSTTFQIMEPKRRVEYNPEEAHKSKAKHLAPKEYQLTEPEHDMVFVNPQTGKIHEKCLHINCVGISEDETFKIGRGMERSDEVQLLDLSGNYIVDAAGAYMMERLNEGLSAGHSRNLRSLNLGGNTLGPRTFHALSQTLSLPNTLTSLNLSSLFAPLSDDDGAQLMEGMSDNKTLMHLDLSGNMLGKAFCWELRGVVMRHPALQTIRLESNDIGDDAAFSIAAALKRNPNSVVSSIHLGWNKVDHVAFGAFMEACAQPGSRLALLNLENNRISRASSGEVVDSLARTTCLATLCLAHNRLADMSEIGLGLYYNRSLKNLDVSYNLLANDAFAWFAAWGKDRRMLALTQLARFDLRGNKLGDIAAKHICTGLGRRAANRVLTSVEVEENLIDPLMMRAVKALVNPFRPFQINKREAKALVRSKFKQDKDYWKERDWEAVQRKRQAALEQAVKLLNSRSEDEVELDQVVGAPLVSRVPLVKTAVVAAAQWSSGVKPLWKIQQDIISEQRKKAARDIALRKSLVKGFDQK